MESPSGEEVRKFKLDVDGVVWRFVTLKPKFGLRGLLQNLTKEKSINHGDLTYA
jgi:hypothetical protein